MDSNDDEERLLRSVALQNAQSILLARQRAEDELFRAKEALERKSQELASSLAMMRATLESTTDGILATDGGGRVTGFSDKFVQMWQLPREIMDLGNHQQIAEIISRNFNDPQQFLARIEEIYSTSPPESYDLLELPDGRVFERFSRIQFVEERNVGRVWSLRDITDRRRAQEALADQSERLRVTLASIGDAVITTDTKGRVAFLNGAAESLTGWSQSEAAGQPLETIFHIVNETTREPVENPATKALREGVIVGLANHTVLIAKDGTERGIDDSAAPIRSAHGEVVGCVLVFRDITEHRRAEKALRRSERDLSDFFANASVGLHWVGPDGLILRANQTELDMLGYSREEYVGHHIAEFHVDLPVIEEILTCLARGDTLSEYPARLRCKDGSIRDVLINSNVYYEDGKFIHTRCFTRDVTEIKWAHAAQARLAAIVDASEDVIISKTLDGIILSWNAAAERLFEYPAAEAVGQPMSLIIPPELWDEERSILERLRRGERIGHFETRRVSKSGRSIDISLTISPLRDSSGRIVGASAIARDISERKRTEEALRRSEARKTAMFETALDCIISIDHEGTIIEFNPAAEQTFGHRREHVVGRELAAAIIPPALRERHRKGLAHFRATGQAPILNKRLELSALRADGTEFPVELTVTRIPVAGPSLFTAYVRDITLRKQAEEELRERERQFGTLAEWIPQLAWMANPDGHIFWYNRRWYEYTGTTLEQMQGWGWQEVHDPEVLPSVLEKWKGSIATGTAFDMVFPLRGADGVFRPFLTRVLPLKDLQGRVIRWFGTNTDISEQRRAEEQLRRLAADLSESDHRKDEFLAMLAHELRNPLAPIRNALQIVQLSAGNEAAVQSASETMDRQIRHMVRLVDDLLDVSRISRGKIDLRQERVELASIIHQAVESSRPAITSGQHQLTVTLPPQPVYLEADPVRLAQVFSNLLNNASKYSDPNGRISITVEQQDGEVAVSVKDTGVGISSDMLPKIFEMFTQVDTSLERSQGGLGIGLTLVERLVEMHGGSVSARSEGPGRGSEFVVRLPIMFETPNTQQTPEPTVSDLTRKTSRRILVVDDNRDSATTLAMLLKLTGNETHTAYDGLAAVEAAETFRPDVVLLDLGLPKLNGFEAARKIREQPWGKSIVLVALTGWGQEDDRRKSSEAGFNGHLVKPVDHAALMKLLAELLPTAV